MKACRVEGNACYILSAIQEEHPSLFKGCKTAADFIDRHEIPKGSYVYARLKGEVWTSSNGKSKRFDKLFIRRSFFRDHLASAAVTYPKLPNEIKLDEEECFHGENGEVLEIRVVGERAHDCLYFCGDDVSVAFGMPSLVKNVRHKDSNHEEEVHYRMFIIRKADSHRLSDKIVLYFTFDGVLKVLYGSYGKKTAPFLSWATKILYTAKMGTVAQRRELASDVAGVSVAAIKKWCKITAGNTPCIYLFLIGTVKDLRKSMGISDRYKDADKVYKLGQTGNLSKRTTQHAASFRKIKGATLDLACHAYIDPRYVCEAEKMIKDTAADMDVYLAFQNTTEMIVLSKKQLVRFEKQYLRAFSLYRGCVGELSDRVRDRDHTIALMTARHEIELMKVRHENELLRMRLANEQ